MKRLLAVTATVAAIMLVGPGAASARYVTGTYSGRTSQGLPMSFKVTRGKVSAIKYEVRINCTDDYTRTFPSGTLQASFPIRRDRFDGRTERRTFRFRIVGRLSGRVSSGYFHARYISGYQGANQCASGRIRFSVKRR